MIMAAITTKMQKDNNNDSDDCHNITDEDGVE
jgi:hypothetical protein